MSESDTPNSPHTTGGASDVDKIAAAEKADMAGPAAQAGGEVPGVSDEPDGNLGGLGDAAPARDSRVSDIGDSIDRLVSDVGVRPGSAAPGQNSLPLSSLPSIEPEPAAASASASSTWSADGARKGLANKEDRPTASRMVELSSDEQRRLEDIRRKLKDIFVTAEKPAPTPDTTKPAQQTESSGLLDLRDLAKATGRARESSRVDDDMVNLSGGLFGAQRSTDSLLPPDISTSPPPPPPPPPKPPPPPQLRALATAEQVIEVDEVEVEVDVAPEMATPFFTSSPSKPPITADPVVTESVAAFKPGMSVRTIVALTLAGALLFGSVFFLAMGSGGDEPEKAAALDTTAGARMGTEVGRDDVQPPVGDTAGTQPGEPHGTVETEAKNTADKPKKDKGNKGDTAKTTGSKGAAAAPDAPQAASPAGKSKTTAAAQTAAPPSGGDLPKAPQTPAAEEFDRSAATAALSAAASRAKACKGDGPGVAQVSVTFAPSGRVTSARVDGPPFSGTPTGGCIATAFRSASIPPFGGSSITVRKTVSIR